MSEIITVLRKRGETEEYLDLTVAELVAFSNLENTWVRMNTKQGVIGDPPVTNFYCQSIEKTTYNATYYDTETSQTVNLTLPFVRWKYDQTALDAVWQSYKMYIRPPVVNSSWNQNTIQGDYTVVYSLIPNTNDEVWFNDNCYVKNVGSSQYRIYIKSTDTSEHWCYTQFYGTGYYEKLVVLKIDNNSYTFAYWMRTDWFETVMGVRVYYWGLTFQPLDLDSQYDPSATQCRNYWQTVDYTYYIKGVPRKSSFPEPDPDTDPDEDTLIDLGGEGSFDFTSDQISVPDLPSISGCNTGFMAVLIPNSTQLQAIATSLFDPSLWVDICNFFNGAKPLDCIVSFKAFPFYISHDMLATSIGLGGQTVLSGLTGDDRIPATSIEYRRYVLGVFDFTQPIYDSFLDFAPYTRVKIHLAYCGDFELDPNDVWGYKLKVIYDVDIITGDFLAYIVRYTDENVDSTVRYTFNGNCARDIPIFARSSGIADSLKAGAITLPILAKTGMMSLANGGVGMAGAILGLSMAFNESRDISHTGSIQSTNAGSHECYITFDLPHVYQTRDFASYKGIVSHAKRLISSLEGYNKIEAIHLTSIPALQDELEEIDKLLKEGVEL